MDNNLLGTLDNVSKKNDGADPYLCRINCAPTTDGLSTGVQRNGCARSIRTLTADLSVWLHSDLSSRLKGLATATGVVALNNRV